MSRKVCVIVTKGDIAIKFYGEDVAYDIGNKSIVYVTGFTSFTEFTSVKFDHEEEMPCIDGNYSFNDGYWDTVVRFVY